jgi:hypothetical protein
MAPSAKPYDNYQAEDDVRTLTRAHSIRSDKKRHGAAKKEAKRQLAALSQVGGLSPMDGETKGEQVPK